MYVIYADGACQPNPGESGSGVIVYKNNKLVRLFYGNYKSYATNNIAELEALKFAIGLSIKCIGRGENYVQILTDSTYAIGCMTQWIDAWLLNNWKKGTVKNKEIIEVMYEEYRPYKDNISIRHVRGHAGIEGNELADRMALHALHNRQVEYKDFGAHNSIDDILKMYQD